MKCYICGGTEFTTAEVLWPELISEWQLSEYETQYIDKQQGMSCDNCHGNLRSMTLAMAIMKSYDYNGTFEGFVDSSIGKSLSVLEINDAGSLTPLLEKLPSHQLVSYPDYDMTKLKLDSASYDLVVHSDTLEHVENPVAGLSECLRVLKTGGRCIFTIPIVVDRLTRSRAGLANSFHGQDTTTQSDFIVHTEFGMDAWKYVTRAGFSSTTIHCADYPAGLAIEAKP